MTIEELLASYDGDVYLYYGTVSREGYKRLTRSLEQKADKKNRVCLILVTYGGDPDAGYRISRALHHHYDEVEILIPDVCKSAGTLICIGANKLIFGDMGELGPLDIQLSKPDELFENMSGLDIIQALNNLEDQMLASFKKSLVDIRGGGGLRTKMAADISVKLAESLFAPIASRIDPLTLGEHQRAMQIAFDYGHRLNEVSKSLKQDALIRLVSNYPSHGFVIDRKEASTLFNNVCEPQADTMALYVIMRGVVESNPLQSSFIVGEVGPIFGLKPADNTTEGEGNEISDDENSSSGAEEHEDVGSTSSNDSDSEPEGATDESDIAQSNQN